MPNTEPATSHDAAGQGSAQQPHAGLRGRPRFRLRGTSLDIGVMLIAQLILGVGVNPNAALRHQGGSPR